MCNPLLFRELVTSISKLFPKPQSLPLVISESAQYIYESPCIDIQISTITRLCYTAGRNITHRKRIDDRTNKPGSRCRNLAFVQKTAAEVQATNANLRRLKGLFSSQWGRLMEALIQPGLLLLFQARGHQVRRLHQRSKAQHDGDTMEIDVFLEGSTEVIGGEVKSSVGIEEVNTFLTGLAEFTKFFPLYRGYQIYSALAGLEFSAEIARYAYRKGLFVLTVGREDLVTILNDDKFRPHNFGGGVQQI